MPLFTICFACIFCRNVNNIQIPVFFVSRRKNAAEIRRPGSACTVILILCSIQKMSAKTPSNQNPKSKIRNPKSKIQNPKSKIQNPKSKIQNPKSEIQNPKSKIRNPKSKIQNPKFRKFGAVGASCKGMLHNDPKSKIQTPKSKIPEIRPKKFGFWILDWGILDFGFRILDFGGVRGMYH